MIGMMIKCVLSLGVKANSETFPTKSLSTVEEETTTEIVISTYILHPIPSALFAKSVNTTSTGIDASP